MIIKHVDEWKEEVYPILLSKQNEFLSIGYDDVSIDQIWTCLVERVWKNNPNKKLHEIVQDIFHLRASTYMGFITINALQDEETDMMESIRSLMGNEETKEK